MVVPEDSQEIESLLCLLNDGCGVGPPGQVLLDVHPQEAEGCDPLHAATVDEQGLDRSLLPPEVDDDLPGFELVQQQVISLALLAQLLHLVPEWA